MTRLIKALFHRRVPQVAAVYAGALWGIVQFADFAVTRYHLPERTIDWLFFGFLGLAPSVLLIAWNHGAPGRDRWTRSEITFALGNAALVALMLFQFGPRSKDAGSAPSAIATPAAAALSPSTDDASIRALTKAQIFFLRPSKNSKEAIAASFALTALIQTDLLQDDRLNVETPMDGYQRPLMGRLKRGGFEDGIGAPAPLLSDIAEQSGAGYFVTGNLVLASEQVKAVVEIYSAQPSRLLRRAEVEARSLAQLADEISVQIRNALAAPSNGQTAEIADDLPVASLSSEQGEAIVAWGEGLVALAARNDSIGAIAAFERAVKLDPSFAIAHLALTESLYTSGQGKAALAAARATEAVQFRLSESQQFALRSYMANLKGRPDEVIKTIETWVEARPQDLSARTALAFSWLTIGNDPTRALAQFESIVELDPGNPWARAFAVRLKRQLGDDEAALALQKKYAEALPRRPSGWVELADFEWLLGHIDDAAKSYERALRLRGDVVSPSLSYAAFLIQQGDFPRARQLLDDARQIARDAQQRALVINVEISWLQAQNRIVEAAALVDSVFKEFKEYLNAYELNAVMGEYAALIAEAKGTESAKRWVASTLRIRELDDPQSLLILAVARQAIANQSRDVVEIEASIDAMQVLLRGSPALRTGTGDYFLSESLALLAELRGDPKTAQALYQRARAQFRLLTSVLTEPMVAEIRLGSAIARTARLAGAAKVARDELARVRKLAPKSPLVVAEIVAAGAQPAAALR